MSKARAGIKNKVSKKGKATARGSSKSKIDGEHTGARAKRGSVNPFPYNSVALAFTLGTAALSAQARGVVVPSDGGLSAGIEAARMVMPLAQGTIPYGAMLSAITPQLIKAFSDKKPETTVFIAYLMARLQRGKIKGIGG